MPSIISGLVLYNSLSRSRLVLQLFVIRVNVNILIFKRILINIFKK